MMLKNDSYSRFKASELTPTGWFRRQLCLQARGLAGHLDEFWPAVADSVWFGGSLEEGECASYWLDGFHALAHLLREPELLEKVERRLGQFLKNIPEDGWLMPACFGRDAKTSTGAYALACRMLSEYIEITGNERVAPILEKGLERIAEHIATFPLAGWGKSRWFEFLPAIFLIYRKTGNSSLLALASILKKQGTDYLKVSSSSCFRKRQCIWSQNTHVVNLAMALKAGTLMAQLDGECGNGTPPDALSEELLQRLLKWHGTPYGHFNGDECLASHNPNQGTELCSVVEHLYSAERIFMACGNPVWLDRLEKIAFNALPAAISPDMWSHQYDQQTNQIGCVFEEHPIWTTNAPDSNLFGLEPNCGCCTANMGQGWPKLAMTAFLRGSTGILSAVPLPMELRTVWKGVQVSIAQKRDYPFDGRLEYAIETSQPVDFDFFVRIPGFVSMATVNGRLARPGSLTCVGSHWETSAKVDVELEFDVEWLKRPTGLWCVMRGPLLFSRPMPFQKRQFEYPSHPKWHQFPHCDYELHRCDDQWGWGFASSKFDVERRGVGDIPFDPQKPPVELFTEMRPVQWKLASGLNHVCEATPMKGDTGGKVSRQRLVPYACAPLRMTEMPRFFQEAEIEDMPS